MKTAGAKSADIGHAKKLYRKYQKPIEKMPSFLGRLKRHYRLAALTVISKEWLEYKKKKFKLDKYFELVVSSADTGLTKKDRIFYELIVKKLGINAEDCAYIDDVKENLLLARKLGMKTILFKGQKNLEISFKKIGLKF